MDVMLLCEKAAALDAMNRHEEALSALDEAMLADPDDLYPVSYKTDILCSLERDAEALKYQDIMMQKSEDQYTAHLCKGAMLERLCRYDEALESFGEAADMARRAGMPNSEARIEGIRILHKFNRDEEALKLCEEGLADCPGDRTITFHMAHVLFALGRYEEALGCCRETDDTDQLEIMCREEIERAS